MFIIHSDVRMHNEDVILYRSWGRVWTALSIDPELRGVLNLVVVLYTFLCSWDSRSVLIREVSWIGVSFTSGVNWHVTPSDRTSLRNVDPVPYLPVSQNWPLYPWRQLHDSVLASIEQLPPMPQALEAHGNVTAMWVGRRKEGNVEHKSRRTHYHTSYS